MLDVTIVDQSDEQHESFESMRIPVDSIGLDEHQGRAYSRRTTRHSVLKCYHDDEIMRTAIDSHDENTTTPGASVKCNHLCGAPDAPDPLVCGAMHQKAYGYTGYDYSPQHWCNFVKDALFPVWKCLEDADATLGPWANSSMSLDSNGELQCWSNDGRECYVAPEGCKATITSGAKPLSKMVCGCDIMSKFGNTRYDQGPRSFCNFAQKALNASPPNLPCTPPSTVCTFKDGDVIGLQADTGEFVGRCNGCLRKPRTTWDVILLGPLSYSTKWTVRNIPHTGRITLVLDTGAYLGRCHGCAGGATLPDQAFAVPPSGVNYLVDPNVQWTSEEAGPDNRIALKGDMGTYLSRCHGCVPIIGGVPDAMFMHARD
ncbi:hypothetical protein H257_11134 [Aphanomyces astaci]|uniref:Uncharacterized protein n=1 Tax=Aphanomyces astaci TaxID=112090 RepID=W4G5G7_APHAT|nr:hypothetical protein H257_11134 [Aphanomyces astaci]ETV74168.1 hypothetical protein H257_11134 [Aphanomyces astaci]|eukprot:XP_009836274.1 hypothetical protein H257_11134 [Aphanomyces astaci]